MPRQAFDARWEQRYKEGNQKNRYPWDKVVSFIFRHAPRDRPRRGVRIVEVGCGTGSNLWFAAKEGFSVAGIDGSATAIESARQLFAAEGLVGDFLVGDFTQPMPLASEEFDLAIDRGALSCVGYSAARRAIAELHRILRPGGLLLFNPYSRAHSSFAAGVPQDDGLVDEITSGTMVGVGALCFYSEEMVRGAVAGGWQIVSLTHGESRTSGPTASPHGADADVHAEWDAIVRKLDRHHQVAPTT